MAKKKTAKKRTKPANFEDGLARLEQIVHVLEEGEIGLDGALTHYEEGVGLLRHCYTQLEQAERRIEVLAEVREDGTAVVEPFDATATFSEGKQPPQRQGSTKSIPRDGRDDTGVDDRRSLF